MAWGLQHKGTYIDAQGSVYDYERHHPIWEPYNRNRPYHVELLEKYAQKELRGSVNSEELSEMKSLIAAAAQEELREYNCCADAGTTTYIAYVYSGRGQYQLVKLYQSGDLSGENPSEEAAELSQWLYAMMGGKGNLYVEDRGCHCLKDY